MSSWGWRARGEEDHMLSKHEALDFLTGVEPDEKLYKIIKLKYVLMMFRNFQIRINNVRTWEDVYENYFLKQNLYFQGKRIDSKDVEGSYFGMSWSLLSESDAMWRIYSKAGTDFVDIDSVGIKVETTAYKLLTTFFKRVYNSPAFIYKVDYRSQEEIEGHLAYVKSANVGEEIRRSLFTKREEFSHESEARVIVGIDTTPSVENMEYCDVGFDPYDMFDGFVIDPRVTPEQEEQIRNLLHEAGVQDDKVSKSQLYTFHAHDIELSYE